MKAKLLPILKKLAVVLVLWAACRDASSQNFSWARKWGGDKSDIAYNVEVDAEGNSYVIGIFSGRVDFGPGISPLTLTSGVSGGAFVGKYSPQGRPLWVKSFQGPGRVILQAGSGIAIDKEKSVYTTGVFRGTVDFDPGPGTANLSSYKNELHSFVCKLDSAGNFEWVKRLGKDTQPASVEASAIAVDRGRNVYIGGSFKGVGDFDPGPASHEMFSGKFKAAFTVKLDGSGNFLWAGRQGAEPNEFAETLCMALALDADDAVYTTGSYLYGTDFDPGPGVFILSTSGIPVLGETSGIYVSKLDTYGNFVWAKNLGSGNYFEQGTDIVVDGQKNIYTTGNYASGADFDPGPGAYILPAFSSSEHRTFISKLDASGGFVWARSLNDAHGLVNTGIKQRLALDADGDLYLSGAFGGTVDFNAAPASSILVSAGGLDGFVGKWDASGNLVWVKAFGGPAQDIPLGIGVDDRKNVYTVGGFAETADFNPDAGVWNLTSAGDNDAFLLKLSRCAPIHETRALGLCSARYVWPLDGQVYAASGTYWGAAKSAAGCDSVVVLQLTLNPVQGAVQPVDVCKVGYTWPQNGITYNAPGLYRDTVSVSGGCDSIVYLQLEMHPSVSYRTEEVCKTYTWPLNGETYTASGTYPDTLLVAGGCDSVRMLVLEVKNIHFDNRVTMADAYSLTSTQPYVEYYSWFDCGNGFALLSSGTWPYYYPPASGVYAVAVTVDGCTDTSSCGVFTLSANAGVEEAEAGAFKIFPNPVRDQFRVQSAGADEIHGIEVVDLNGRPIYAVRVTGTVVTVPAAEWKAGVYFVRVVSEKGLHIYKVCKL